MENDTSVLNITGRICTFIEDNDEGLMFSCNNPMFASLTLLFVYLPSQNVLATLYGPRTAGGVGTAWGFLLMISSSFLGVLDFEAIGNCFLILGMAMAFWGLIGVSTLAKSQMKTPQDQDEGKCKSRILNVLIFYMKFFSLILSIPGLLCPFLLPFTPFIFIIIKFMGLIKPNNKLLKAQSTVGGRGESILEAAPQFGLQCYIMFLSLKHLGWIQWISIITSALTLNVKNIEHYVTARLEEKKVKTKDEEFELTLKIKMKYSKTPQEQFKPELRSFEHLSTNTFEEFFPKSSIELTSKGLTSMEVASTELRSKYTYGPIMAIMKNIGVFMPQFLSKILAVSILGVFLKSSAILIIFSYTFGLFFCLMITRCCCNIFKAAKDVRQLMECCFLGWLTISNLGRGKTAEVLRLVSSLYWTVAHTINIIVILVICNTDPGIADRNLAAYSEWSHELFTWSEPR